MAVDLFELGARVVSVFGPPDGRSVLIEMPADRAAECFPERGLDGARRSLMVDAAEREVARIAELAPDLAEGALAASVIAMAFEVDDPFNSATSKSMCQARMQDALKELRALAPARRERDGIDELGDELAERRGRLAAGGARTPGS